MSRKNIFWWWSGTALLLVILLSSCVSAKPTPAPEPTPTPEGDSTEAALGVVMDALEPIIESVAAQIDQGTMALAENTKSVHKSDDPTAEDAMIKALFICTLPICLVILTIVVFLFRDPQVARSVALFIGTWYHEQQKEAKNGIINSSSTPVPAEPDREPDINIG